MKKFLFQILEKEDSYWYLDVLNVIEKLKVKYLKQID